MYQTKNVVYIPHWIQELCQRHSLPLEAVLDYSKIGPLLSLEDQALFLGLQSYSLHDCAFNDAGIPTRYRYATGDIGSITESPDTSGLRCAWKKTILAEDVGSKRSFDVAENLSYTDSITADALTTRLFSVDAAELSHKKAFITYDLTREVVGVVVYPGYFNREKFDSFKFDLVVSILKVLYVYNTYAAECKTPYFRKYLETLAARNG